MESPIKPVIIFANDDEAARKLYPRWLGREFPFAEIVVVDNLGAIYSVIKQCAQKCQPVKALLTDERFQVEGEGGQNYILASREVRHIRNELMKGFGEVGEAIPIIITSGGWRPALPPDVCYLDGSVYYPDERNEENPLLRMLRAALGLSDEDPLTILRSTDRGLLGR